ncbi:MAG: HNH endonuclease signature motif containing protein [Candidatus Nanopelagicales bacterium]
MPGAGHRLRAGPGPTVRFEPRQAPSAASGGRAASGSELRYLTGDPTVTPIRVASDPPPRGHPRPSALAVLIGSALRSPRPLDVGRTQRFFTPAIRKALELRDRRCIVPGCQIGPERCQAHHIQDWAKGGPTSLANAALLCHAHHRQVDLGLWTIQPDEEHNQTLDSQRHGGPRIIRNRA